MSETTLTHINSTVGKGLNYANGEMAWITGDNVRSSCMYSTAIAYWDYSVVTKNFIVKYKSSEKFYQYEGVPYSVIIEMMFADSIGAFIAKQIKPNYSVA
jgi:hypothetical protein